MCACVCVCACVLRVGNSELASILLRDVLSMNNFIMTDVTTRFEYL